MKNLKFVYLNNVEMSCDEESLDYLFKHIPSADVSHKTMELKNKIIQLAKDITKQDLTLEEYLSKE